MPEIGLSSHLSYLTPWVSTALASSPLIPGSHNGPLWDYQAPLRQRCLYRQRIIERVLTPPIVRV